MPEVNGETSRTNIFIAAKWLSFNILKHLNHEQKFTFRKLEKSLLKVTKKRLDISFNEQCLKNNPLPKSAAK